MECLVDNQRKMTKFFEDEMCGLALVAGPFFEPPTASTKPAGKPGKAVTAAAAAPTSAFMAVAELFPCVRWWYSEVRMADAELQEIFHIEAIPHSGAITETESMVLQRFWSEIR